MSPLNQSSDNNGFEGWFSPWRFAAILFLLVAAGHPDVLLGTQTFYFRDYASFGYPLAHYHRQAFWSGEIPLWNPLSSCGIPYVAQWNTLVFYPGSLLYLMFPLPYSLAFYCLAHQFFAGMAMYFLARNWTHNNFAAAVAGVSYALSGLLINSLMWPNNIAAFAWMPLVVLANELAWERGRRHILLAAVVSACQMLAGAPEIIIFTWLIVVVLFGRFLWAGQAPWRMGLLRGALVPFLTAGLSAIQLLPFLQFLGHSQRGTTYTMSGWDMPATGWANFIVPLFQTMATSLGVFLQHEQQWTSSYYVPLVAWPFVAVALLAGARGRVLVLAVVLMASMVLALGENWFAYGWLKKFFPFLAYMRFPVKLVVLSVFCIPLLAACGIARWKTLQRPTIAVVATILILLAIPYLTWHGAKWPELMTDWNAMMKNGVLRGMLLIVAISIFFVIRKSASRKTQIFAAVIAVLVVGFDGLTNMPLQNPTIPRESYNLPPPAISPLPQHGTGRAFTTGAAHERFNRVWTSEPVHGFIVTKLGLFANANLLFGIPKFDGFYSLYPRYHNLLFELVYRYDRVPGKPLLDFMGVVATSQQEKVFDWDMRESAMPFLTGGQEAKFLEHQELLNTVFASDWNPRTAVYFHTNLMSQIQATNQASVEFTDPVFQSHSIRAAFEADGPALVVAAQNYYPNWKAYVDSVETPVLRANHAFQAIQVPPGKHTLELRYEDSSFALGWKISLATAGLMTLGWILAGRKRLPA